MRILLLTFISVSPLLLALPPSGTQCAGYGYSRSLNIVTSDDGLSVVATSIIGGFNPCSFYTSVTVASPSGRPATAEYGPSGSYNAGSAQATATLGISGESGVYTATATYGVEDDTVYPWMYYYPNTLSQTLDVTASCELAFGLASASNESRGETYSGRSGVWVEVCTQKEQHTAVFARMTDGERIEFAVLSEFPEDQTCH